MKSLRLFSSFGYNHISRAIAVLSRCGQPSSIFFDHLTVARSEAAESERCKHIFSLLESRLPLVRKLQLRCEASFSTLVLNSLKFLDPSRIEYLEIRPAVPTVHALTCLFARPFPRLRHLFVDASTPRGQLVQLSQQPSVLFPLLAENAPILQTLKIDFTDNALQLGAPAPDSLLESVLGPHGHLFHLFDTTRNRYPIQWIQLANLLPRGSEIEAVARWRGFSPPLGIDAFVRCVSSCPWLNFNRIRFADGASLLELFFSAKIAQREPDSVDTVYLLLKSLLDVDLDAAVRACSCWLASLELRPPSEIAPECLACAIDMVCSLVQLGVPLSKKSSLICSLSLVIPRAALESQYLSLIKKQLLAFLPEPRFNHLVQGRSCSPDLALLLLSDAAWKAKPKNYDPNYTRRNTNFCFQAFLNRPDIVRIILCDQRTHFFATGGVFGFSLLLQLLQAFYAGTFALLGQDSIQYSEILSYALSRMDQNHAESLLHALTACAPSLQHFVLSKDPWRKEIHRICCDQWALLLPCVVPVVHSTVGVTVQKLTALQALSEIILQDSAAGQKLASQTQLSSKVWEVAVVGLCDLDLPSRHLDQTIKSIEDLFGLPPMSVREFATGTLLEGMANRPTDKVAAVRSACARVI